MMDINNKLRLYITGRVDIDSNGCWIWKGDIAYDGYGRFPLHNIAKEKREYLDSIGITNKYSIQAHKLAHLLFNGSLTKDKPLVLHRCSNRACCNPNHLYSGDPQDNVDDMILSGKRSRTCKYKSRPKDVQEEIRLRLRAGESMYSLAKRYGTYVSVIRHYVTTMKKNGEVFAKIG